MLELWQLWLNFKRAVGRRKPRSRQAHDSPQMIVQPLEERRLLAVTAVADMAYDTSSSQLLVADDAAGSDFDPGNNGVLANDVGAVAVASTGTFLTAQGATVTLNADGTFTYDPSTSSAIQTLAPGAVLNDSFNYTATDGLGNFSSAMATVTVTGNYAPEVTEPNPQLFTVVARNDQDSVGMSVGNLQFFLADVESGGSFAPIGVAVVGADASDGRWQFSTDFGVTWFDVGNVSDSNALLLDGDDRVRFVPGPSGDQPSFTYRAWDLSEGSSGDRADASNNGGNTQFSSQVGTSTGIVWTVDVPSDPIIDSRGNTQLTFVLAAPIPSVFDITIDWGDGTIESLGTLTNGTYTVGHTYTSNPAGLGFNSGAPIPILIEAFNFTSSGEEEEGTFTRVLTMASPVLTGTSPDPAPVLPGPAAVTDAPPPVSQFVLPAPATPFQTESVDIRSGGSYLAANPLKQYVLRVVTPVDAQGNVEESPDKPLRDDSLEDLPGLYKQLENDRYRIYELRRDGSYRLVQDVIVRDGVATPVEDEPLPVGWDSVPTPEVKQQAPPDATPMLPMSGDSGNGAAALQDGIRAVTPVGAALVGLRLAAGADARRSWKQRVDEAFESAEAARRLRRLRRRKKSS